MRNVRGWPGWDQLLPRARLSGLCRWGVARGRRRSDHPVNAGKRVHRELVRKASVDQAEKLWVCPGGEWVMARSIAPMQRIRKAVPRFRGAWNVRYRVGDKGTAAEEGQNKGLQRRHTVDRQTDSRYRGGIQRIIVAKSIGKSRCGFLARAFPLFVWSDEVIVIVRFSNWSLALATCQRFQDQVVLRVVKSAQ